MNMSLKEIIGSEKNDNKKDFNRKQFKEERGHFNKRGGYNNHIEERRVERGIRNNNFSYNKYQKPMNDYERKETINTEKLIKVTHLHKAINNEDLRVSNYKFTIIKYYIEIIH